MMPKQKLFFHSDDGKIEIVYVNNTSMTYPCHTHVDNYMIGLVLDGVIRISHEKFDSSFVAGEIFVIPPNFAHSLCACNQAYSLLSVCLPVDVVYQLGINDLMKKMQDIFAEIIVHGVLVQAQADMLLDGIEVLYFYLSQLEITGDAGVVKVADFLRSMPEQSFPIQSLAKEVSISPYHLIRKFKQKYELTPHQFQIQNRIRKAQRLLQNSRDITKIALDTGFCDQSHFNHCFRKIVGMKPTEYIRAQRNL